MSWFFSLSIPALAMGEMPATLESSKLIEQQYFCRLLFVGPDGVTSEANGISVGDKGYVLMISLEPSPKEAQIRYSNGTLGTVSRVAYDQFIGLHIFKASSLKAGGIQFTDKSHHRIFMRKVNIITPYEIAEANVIGPERTAGGMGFMLDNGIKEGSLVYYQGECYGITGLPDSRGEISHGIPYSIIRPLLDGLESYGKIERPYLGVLMFGLREEMSVIKVTKNSSADKAGIKHKDIIKTINNIPITNSGIVQSIVKDSKVGDRLDLVIVRNGKDINMTVTLEAFPE